MAENAGRLAGRGEVGVRRTSTAAHAAQVDQLLGALALPADTRVWAMVALEGADARLTVRAGAGGVIGEVDVPLPKAVRDVLRALVDEHAPDAKDDLKSGIARTMAAAVAGRSG